MSSDWAQNRAIRDLNEAMDAQAAAAAARQRAVERRLHALQGDLSSKVSTLTFQLNALIELGDLRDELTLYIPMRRARDAAIDLTRAVLRGDGDLTYLRESPDLASDGDYWLVPAALAVVDVRQGVLADDAAATALRLDRTRAATYLVAMTTLAGHPELTTHLLGDCFEAGTAIPAGGEFGSAEGGPAPDPAGATEPTGTARPVASTARTRARQPDPASDPSASFPTVTRAERVLWTATAAGMLGADAVTPVQRLLRERVAQAPPEAWRTSESDPLARPPLLGHLGSGPDPLAGDGTDPILSTWATWAERVGAHELRGGRAVGPAVLGSRASGTTAGARHAAPGAVPQGAAAWGTAADPEPSASDPSPVTLPATIHADLERVAMSLAGEGGPREREMLQRIDLLGTHLGKPADSEAQWWSAPAGGVVELVVADARSADVDAAALVAPLLTPTLRVAADAHRDRLLATPLPTSSIKLVTTIVTVTADDDGSAAAEEARARFSEQPMPRPNLWVVGGLGAAALLFAVLALVLGAPGWWVPAVLAAGGAGVGWVQGHRRASLEAERRADVLSRFSLGLTQAREKVRSELASLSARQESVRVGHAAVTAQLDRVEPID